MHLGEDTHRGVKVFAQEHNTMFPTRTLARNACSEVERVNHAWGHRAKKKKNETNLIHGRLLVFSRSSTDHWDVLEESKVDCSFLLEDANMGWRLPTSYSR